MKDKPDHTDSSLSETMATRIEIKELGDPNRQKELTDAVEALGGVIELKIAKGALHISFDPLATTEKKIEEAVRSTGSTIKAAATDRETPHPDLPNPANVEAKAETRTS
jgi:allophanate hydrolase subunit 1